MKNKRIPFEDLIKLNKRESNFSKEIKNSPINMDKDFLEETSNFYEYFIKPTARDSFSKLVEKSIDKDNFNKLVEI